MAAHGENEELDFGIGADVICKDGRCGKLVRVVIDPGTDEITDLVVQSGFLQKTDRVVPVALVASTGDGSITLTVGVEAVKACPQFHEHHFTTPVEGYRHPTYSETEMRFWRAPYGVFSVESSVPVVEHRVVEGIDSDMEAIGRGTPVLSLKQQRVGEVDHVLASVETGEMTHLVVRRGLFPDYRIVPVAAIDSVAEDGVYLKPGSENMDELPFYRPQPPEVVEAELLSRLSEEDYDYAGLTASMESGILTLTGAVEDVSAKRRAEAAARSTTGVVEVANALDTDTAIASRVVAALEEDPRTKLAVIDVVSSRGQVTLSGKVDTEEIKDAAEEVAAARKGVLSVINELVVGPDEDTQVLLPLPPGQRGPEPYR